MADEMDSETCVDFKRRKSDIEEVSSQPSANSTEDEQSDCGQDFAAASPITSEDKEAMENEVIESRSCLVTKKKQLLEKLESMVKPGDSVATFAKTTEVESVFEEELAERPCRKSGGGRMGFESCGKMYTREKMEALRFANMAEQRKAWKLVYNGLGTVVRKEYDDLASSKRTRHRPAKKEESPAVVEEACSEVKYKGLADMVISDIDDVSPSDAACTYRVGDKDDYPALEGEHTEDVDSEEEYSIQRPAFLVEGEPNFDSGPPEDGLEYLRRVRWEAARIPNVRVAKLDTSKLKKEQSDYMPNIPEIAKCQEHLWPSKLWEDAFLAEFSELRTVMSRLQITNVKSYQGHLAPIILPEEKYSPQLSAGIILDGSEEIKTKIYSGHSRDCSGSENENENDQLSSLYTDDGNISLPPDKSIPKSPVNEDRSNYPLLSLILKMDSVARASMLKKKISSFGGMNALQKNDCLWLFALCAVVDTPLDSDTCASLRSLLRKSSSLLAEKCVLDDEVVMLNILVTISGRYFGQLES